MPVDAQIATVVFIVPFTVTVCIVAVETGLSSSSTALLVVNQNFQQPEVPDDR